MPAYHMELWPGYVTSIRQHERNIFMCCEIITKVMRNDTVLRVLTECSEEDRVNYKRLFAERIIGCIVLTDYNNRTYRIDDVDWNSSPASTFAKGDGTSISYVEYYKNRYKLRIGNSSQPMLVSRAKQRELRAGMSELVYLVPELCRMTGLTDAQRANFRLMQEFAKHTKLGPTQRIQRLQNFSQRLSSKPEVVKELKNWDFKLSDTIVRLQGRVLPAEKLYGANSDYSSGSERCDWSQSVRQVPQYHAPNLREWVCMCIDRNRHSAQRFSEMICRAASGMKWNVGPPMIYDLPNDRPGTYMNELENVIQKYKPLLILCVVSNNKQDRYASIKKKCCVDRAVPTQVILARTLDSKNAMSIATKVAIQMNCKIGGAPWYVKVPLKGLMVVGYDACHDPRQKSKSYGALVASINKTFSRYFGDYTAHTKGEELSNDFALQLCKAIRVYRDANEAIPAKIIIYRDGVGDGNINHVIDYELKHILSVLQENFYKERPVELAFVIVTKRINTRFFSDRGNPPSGTVVDDVVTLPER